MSELKNSGTVEQLIKMFEKHDQVEFELLGVGNTVLSTKYFENAINEIKAWNTRTAAPRFTAVEREAMTTLSDYSECSNLDGCEGCSKENHIGVCKYYVTEGKLLDAIRLVRAMLTEADKGKG